jgi:GNAT superfamily N-acetyltransferase
MAKLAQENEPYDGPYPIFNAAMNLVHAKELAWQERMAESFVLSPLYCGSKTTGYRPTGSERGKIGQYAGGLKMGTAVSLSGAAVSPNWGYHSNAAVTFLLTIFNARLGAWLANPANDDAWKNAAPRWGYFYLFLELFGWTNETGPYVYLSDGGHFENLGVYELVKRRCQFIVVSDADEDPEHAFENLGNMIRKVRIDLGIRVEIVTDGFNLAKESRKCRWHCAIGKVRYDDIDANASPGTLIYVKPSLTGDEPADVTNYAAAHPTFPHESTGNQFYTESQFESYRALGQHVAEMVFERSVGDADEVISPAESMGKAHERWCREFFASLVRRWFAMPPEYDAQFINSTHGFMEVQEALQKNKHLWRLSLDIYPELDPSGRMAETIRETSMEEGVARRTAEVHLLLQMLQVMENAYLSLNLEANYAHPMNRGWIDVFHRWTSAKTFRLHWPHLRGEFGRDFVRFCERQMMLGVVKGKAIPLTSASDLRLLDRLLLEYEEQWDEPIKGARKKLEGRLRTATAFGGPFAWSIYPDNPYPGESGRPIGTKRLPVGVILVWPDPETTEFCQVYELFVWVRGAYRNTGLGRTAVQSVLDDLAKRWPGCFRLKVRLPVGTLTGPGGKLQKAMWLTFYNHLGFVNTGRPSSSSDDETIVALHQDFHGSVLERLFDS